MQTTDYNFSKPKTSQTDFFEYWDSLGFFDNLKVILPSQFFILFEIARVIFSKDSKSDAMNAIKNILENKEDGESEEEFISEKRLNITSPVSDNMEISNYKTIHDLKKALPRELAWDDEIFDIKLFTKSLLVSRYYETTTDDFQPISTMQDKSGSDINRFDQKCFILLDQSKSMDSRMRSFYSKCILAEYLRQKMKSNSRIYFRPFHTDPGKLFKIEKKEDLPVLIERILLAATGGASTNLQKAILTAVDDIAYDKEMTKAEILVITDGQSDIDSEELRNRLRDIKLNILKIGEDGIEQSFFEVEKTLAEYNISFDPQRHNIHEIMKAIQSDDTKGLTISKREISAFRDLYKKSDLALNVLREISNVFIEIPDIDMKALFIIDDEILNSINEKIEELASMNFKEMDIIDLTRIYKMALFLNQYLEMLTENCDKETVTEIKKILGQLNKVKDDLMLEPTLLSVLIESDAFEGDKEAKKLARKELKKNMKQMHSASTHLSNEELKNIQLKLTSKGGMGVSERGLLLRILILKFIEFFKKSYRKIIK